MKYIQKKDVPQFFIDDTLNLTSWDDYHSSKKRRLKKFILQNEQFGLCCYCEKQITIDKSSSHVEHVKPKSLDILELTFNYTNLLVSCEGNHFNEIGDTTKNTCGQIKANNFNENLFLNPTLIKTISDYFIFDNNGIISASQKNKRKALVKRAQKLPLEKAKQKIKIYLQDNNNEFITFLRYTFQYLEKQ